MVKCYFRRSESKDLLLAVGYDSELSTWEILSFFQRKIPSMDLNGDTLCLYYVKDMNSLSEAKKSFSLLENEEGEEIVEELEEMWARAFQHELDHLDGILFVDRVSPLSKRLIAKKLETLKKNFLKGKIYREDVIE